MIILKVPNSAVRLEVRNSHIVSSDTGGSRRHPRASAPFAKLRLCQADAVTQPAPFVGILAAGAQYLKRFESRFKRTSISGIRRQCDLREMQRGQSVSSLDALKRE